MKSRDLSFDFIKGILIILVVLGHAIQMVLQNSCWDNYLFHLIYSFHMPLFFFISGFFFKSCLKMKWKDMIIYKFERLLIPTIIFTSILLIIKYISNEYCFNGIWDFYLVLRTYWFLICLYSLTLFYYLFIKSTIIIRVLLIFTYVLLVANYEKLPVFILVDCQIIRMMLVMGVGILYKMNKDYIDNILSNKIICFVVILILLLEVLLIRYFYGINLLDYSPFIRIMDGICCSLLMFMVLKLMFNIISLNSKKITEYIVQSGLNSLGVYLIHVLICKLMSYNNVYINIYSEYITIFSLFIVIYLLSLYLSKLIKKTTLKKYLLGE